MKLFDSIQVGRPKRNKFDLSHEKKLSCDMGMLIPILCTEVLPGDSFRVNTECLVRFAPLLAPVMHRINVWTHYFFVPNRLLWSEWEDFITGGREGTSAPVMPNFTNALGATSALMGIGSLSDFLGAQWKNGSAAGVDVMTYNALPFRAYQLIYDEYYRDQNLQAALDISLASGAITGAELAKLLTLRKRAWEKDYFTSALPWAQRGGAVGVPITGTAAVTYMPESDVRLSGGGVGPTGSVLDVTALGQLDVGAAGAGRIENIDEITLGNASVTINELRRSSRLQEWLEKNARGGARYIEQILSHFGVKVPDSRLQRPEYLGGGRQPVVISEVLANSTFSFDGESQVVQGNMAGHGFSAGYSNGFKKGFVEHGYIMAFMSILPKTGYSQGVPKHFRRLDKLDYAWPEFANLGEQPILQSELYYDQASASGAKDIVFGYTPRYAEYKYIPSSIHGDFRDTLAFWHADRLFPSAPVLNEAFVASDPTSRIFALDSDLTDTLDKVYVQLFNRVDALRPLPYFGTPML